MSLSKFSMLLQDLDLSSRPRRRRALAYIVDALETVRNEEERYMDRIHPNFKRSDARSNSLVTIAILDNAINILLDAF